ncbi:hypothetical protein DB299_06325 (plasmid) [Borreliella bavariensis PBi]|uniref:Uncharacterized protein n=1 Tax=Borrelia garinii subsp. bavariensis (strain ATCC BAA-2496 / DSM 23469 / PBi) TaxID=290434 RepID=A0ABM7ARQ1_BORGP|nr:hypothetical protein DB299_06325 [Borreliella bavariensis PBi]
MSLLIYLISSLITIFFIPNDKNTDHKHNKKNLTITIIIFLVILISVYFNNLEYFLRKNIDSKVLGTITSINSTLSRIFSFLALCICSILTNFISAINTLVLLILIFCTLSIVVTYKFKNNKKS